MSACIILYLEADVDAKDVAKGGGNSLEVIYLISGQKARSTVARALNFAALILRALSIFPHKTMNF